MDIIENRCLPHYVAQRKPPLLPRPAPPHEARAGERPMATRTQYMGYTHTHTHRQSRVYVFALIFGMAHKSIFRTLIARRRRRRRGRHVAFFLLFCNCLRFVKQTNTHTHTRTYTQLHTYTHAC